MVQDRSEWRSVREEWEPIEERSCADMSVYEHGGPRLVCESVSTPVFSWRYQSVRRSPPAPYKLTTALIRSGKTAAYQRAPLLISWDL